jgi:iron complex transport system substrate-binding protein
MKYLFLFFFTVNLFAYERIIALSPSINEIIYALGDGDKIVGNTEYCNYPEESKIKTKVGGYFSPNLEKMVSLQPDIVIMLESSKKLSRKLHKLGIKTKILKLTKLEEIQSSIRQIGEILNKQKKAQKILDNINTELENIKGIVQNKKILIVISAYGTIEKRVFVAGQNLYFDDIINESGNTNALQSKRKGQPVLNIENIIATNPDIVILLSPLRVQRGLSIDQIKKPWLTLPITAVKENNIYVADKPYAAIASHRLIYFLRDLQGYLTDAKNK